MTSVWTNVDPVEAEGRLRSIRRRLAELDEALQGQQMILRDNPDSFAFQLACESLLLNQQRLQAELIQLVCNRSHEQISLALSGQNFVNHSASLGYLGIFLIRLQKLYSSIGQAIRTGPTLRGPIAADIRSATDLRLSNIYPSSFGMKMFVPSEFDLMGNSVASDSLDALFQLLQSSIEEDRFMRLSGELGRRTFGHLRHVASTLQDAQATLTINWIDYTGTRHNWESTPETNRKIIEQLDKIKETRSEEKRLKGRLVGASLLRNRFELLLPERTIIDGKFVSGLGPEITKAFGSVCNVIVDETEIHDRVSGESKTYYSLKLIEHEDKAAEAFTS